MNDHVGGVIVCHLHGPLRRWCRARRLQSMHGPVGRPGKRSAQGAPATGGDRDRSGNRRERSDRRLQRRARAEGIAQTCFPRQRPRRLPGGTQRLPDIGQPQSGCERTRPSVTSRMRLRSWTRQGPRGSSSRCTTKCLAPLRAADRRGRRRRRHGRRPGRCGIHPEPMRRKAMPLMTRSRRCRASRSARTSDAQAAARASTSPWQLCSG